LGARGCGFESHRPDQDWRLEAAPKGWRLLAAVGTGPSRSGRGDFMPSRNVPTLLRRWRDAEMEWGRTAIHDDAGGALRRVVVEAWREYNAAAGAFDEDEIVLVADDTMHYVAVFGPTERLLAWPSDFLGGGPRCARA